MPNNAFLLCLVIWISGVRKFRAPSIKLCAIAVLVSGGPLWHRS